MARSKNDFGLILKLLAGIAVGVVVGLVSNEDAMQAIGSIKHLCGQLIFYTVPLVIIGFIAPSITRLGKNASRMLIGTVTMPICPQSAQPPLPPSAVI